MNNVVDCADQLEDKLQSLKIQIFADGADLDGMLEFARKSYIRGFTTNPTLMRRAGVQNYEAFAREVLAAVPDRPISFEVLADEFDEMERQALTLADWGDNVYVKIPVTNTRREPAYDLVRRLAHAGVKVNATAVMTLEQVHRLVDAMRGGAPGLVSVFAGRIADTGRDPVPMMSAAVAAAQNARNVELLWASVREVLNIFQADACGCHVVTVTNAILKQLPTIGKSLEDYSAETVRMFVNDARLSGYSV